MWQTLLKALVLSVVLSAGVVESQSEACRNENDIVNQILLSYDKKTAPREASGGPVKIEVELWVQDIYELDVNDLELDLYVSTTWNDERLRYAHLKPCHREVTLTDGAALWTPELSFIDSKKTEVYSTPTVNDFKLIYASGKVWTNQRLRMKIPCSFHSTFRFPFDEIECSTNLQSIRYGNRDVMLGWGNEPLKMLKEVPSLSGFFLTNHTTIRNAVQYPAGQWTEMPVTLHFHRNTMAAFLYTFVPAILAVFTAGITFFLGRKSSVARAILAASSLFFLIYLTKEVGREAPGYYSFKMIDIYFFVCILFVLSALVELALANGCSNRGHYQLNGSSDGFKPLTQSETGNRPVRFCRRHCGKFDVSAGVLYFGLFVGWNVVYFLVLITL
uniref:Neurotransmitter-gated ion-channel ligand-binding domain-containing protein n=1 Tax=Plectus sambesii TaxID=2011161 RepID=A0A914X201_9BILA